jgi:hypothetical protein
MKCFIPHPLIVLLLMFTGVSAPAASNGMGGGPLFEFADGEYFFRWSKDDQYEFTPRGQDDLERWTDMVTLRRYRSVTDGERLATAANTVLANYKRNGAMIVRMDSKPRTVDKPAEHLIVVLFPRKDFIEAVFARFMIAEGMGGSVIYSHRIYGQKAGKPMSGWLKANGPAIEKALMRWEGFPWALDKVEKR